MAMSRADKALINAAENGNNNLVIKALDQGADIHAQADEALRMAAIHARNKTVALLLDRGADIHADNDGPLRLAARYGNEETVGLLLDHGADIHANGKMTLYLPSMYGHEKVVELLLDSGADIHVGNDYLIHEALAKDKREMALLLLRHGAVPNIKDPHITIRLAQWLDELKPETSEFFKSGHLSQEQCFTNGKLNYNILNACVTNQFVTLIGPPLIASTDKADRQLFQDIWEALPAHWQDQNQNIYMQFIKEGGIYPVVGQHTDATQQYSETPDSMVGR